MMSHVLPAVGEVLEKILRGDDEISREISHLLSIIFVRVKDGAFEYRPE